MGRHVREKRPIGDITLAKAARSRTTTRKRSQAGSPQPKPAVTAASEAVQPEATQPETVQPDTVTRPETVIAEASPPEIVETLTDVRAEAPVEAPSEAEPALAAQQEEKGSAYPAEALYFDANWYLAAYPDVGACGIDAVEHFMTHGYLEGRDPNGHFSVAEYIAANPDIPLTINPFLHFIMHGAAEGRPLRR